jgi:hypothetical protein
MPMINGPTAAQQPERREPLPPALKVAIGAAALLLAALWIGSCHLLQSN